MIQKIYIQIIFMKKSNQEYKSLHRKIQTIPQY